MNLPKCH